MEKDRTIIVFDCNGDARPAVCFNLEVANYQARIVFDEKEAVNLLKIAEQTGERFECLLVNNPFLNVDITWLVEQAQRLGIAIPILFVKQSEPLKKIVMAISKRYPELKIYFSEPGDVSEFLQRLNAERTGEDETNRNSGRPKFGWRWQWGKPF